MNPYRIAELEQYRGTSTFQQLIATARRYELKWMAKHGRSKDGWILNYVDLLELVRTEATFKYFEIGQWEQYNEDPKTVTLLDSLVVCYQLLQLCSNTTV